MPADWFAKAGTSHADIGVPGFGYGYQWWTYPGDAYGAQGIFVQGITIMPKQRIVFAVVSNWPVASSRKLTTERLQFFQKLAEAAQ